MKKNIALFCLLTALAMSTTSPAQTPQDYINAPGPIAFESKAYNLSWTSHPAANFYKQEYIVKGDNAEKYKTMILMDVVTGEATLKDAVAAKVAELRKMKAANPVVNYEVINNAQTGEYVIDFLVSANAADGTISIVERNVYRYKNFTDKAGHKGVLLFGVSTRAYGAGVTPFLTALKSNRKILMNNVVQFKTPEIGIKK